MKTLVFLLCWSNEIVRQKKRRYFRLTGEERREKVAKILKDILPLSENRLFSKIYVVNLFERGKRGLFGNEKGGNSYLFL